MRSHEKFPDLPEDALIKAARLIREKGFDATSINEISRAIGITKGGLYYYIRGKHDLLYRIMKHGLDEVESWTREIQHVDDPDEQLRRLIRRHIEAIARGRGALTAITEEVNALDDERRVELLAMKRSYFDFLRDILGRLQAEGRLRDTDLAVAAFNVLGMILHFARWYRPDGRLSPGQIADQITDMAIHGLYRDGRPT
jgi:AcrR family transcriptional regulator